MNTPLLDRIERAKAQQGTPSTTIRTQRRFTPEWVKRAQENRLVAKEYKA